MPLERKRAIHSLAPSTRFAPFGVEFALGFVRHLAVGLADGIGPRNVRRDGGRGLVVHHQPLVLVVQHDARRQRIDRFLKQVARVLDLHLALLEVGDIDPEADRADRTG